MKKSYFLFIKKHKTSGMINHYNIVVYFFLPFVFFTFCFVSFSCRFVSPKSHLISHYDVKAIGSKRRSNSLALKTATDFLIFEFPELFKDFDLYQ